MPTWLTRIIATGFYTGLSPTVPGTVGTIPAWVLLWFFFPQNTTVQIVILVAITAVSVRFATEAERLLGHDAKKIVIDEWAGMVVSVLFLPHTLTAYALAFGAFRLFDVIKLWPAGRLEKLPEGWGVTMDDVAAGVQANVLVRIIILIIARAQLI